MEHFEHHVKVVEGFLGMNQICGEIEKIEHSSNSSQMTSMQEIIREFDINDNIKEEVTYLAVFSTCDMQQARDSFHENMVIGW